MAIRFSTKNSQLLLAIDEICYALQNNTQATNKTITVNKNSKCLLKTKIPFIVTLAGSDK